MHHAEQVAHELGMSSVFSKNDAARDGDRPVEPRRWRFCYSYLSNSTHVSGNQSRCVELWNKCVDSSDVFDKFESKCFLTYLSKYLSMSSSGVRFLPFERHDWVLMRVGPQFSLVRQTRMVSNEIRWFFFALRCKANPNNSSWLVLHLNYHTLSIAPSIIKCSCLYYRLKLVKHHGHVNVNKPHHCIFDFHPIEAMTEQTRRETSMPVSFRKSTACIFYVQNVPISQLSRISINTKRSSPPLGCASNLGDHLRVRRNKNWGPPLS